ncbi:hypothetical protein BGW37DRAFT_9260 [Umbelopsis sp. PMI_123]|nr:hypothetical protein BGW37DRAFT_9260 [Umbelopsis sp. PMI_123]
MATNYADLRKIMTGEIIVKCKCGDEIRRIPINQTPTYDELCVMMHRLFMHKISNIENIILRYTDDEGDLIVLSDDMDIVHAISQRNVLKVTVFDKERHPLPRDSWDQGLQSVTQRTLDYLQRDLLTMRATINDLLGQLGDKNTTEEKRDHHDGDKPSYKQLSTTDMAEFLEESHSKRKDSYNTLPEATSPKKLSPSAQRQSTFSYPQPVPSAPMKAPTVTSNQQYYPAYQQPQQQAPTEQSYPQQQQPPQQPPQQQQHHTVKPTTKSAYATSPAYRPSPNYSNAVPTIPYGQPPQQRPPQAVEPQYQQARPPPPPPQSNHLHNAPATPSYSQPQATAPSYSYPDNNRWR